MMSSRLEQAFDDAIAQAETAKAGGMLTLSGESAEPQLIRLAEELRRERMPAIERGVVDRDWFQRTLKWVVEWAPEDDLTLIASLGRIARAPTLGVS